MTEPPGKPKNRVSLVNEMVIPTTVTVPDVVSLPGQINMSLGTWYLAIHSYPSGKCLFLHTY